MLRRFLSLALLALVALPAHAGTTCTTLRRVCSGTAGTTWTEFILPAWTATVTIEVSGAAYVDGPGGGYTDGAARSSGGRSTTSGEVLSWPIPDGSAKSIWVAGNGASRTVTIVPFGSEGR